MALCGPLNKWTHHCSQDPFSLFHTLGGQTHTHTHTHTHTSLIIHIVYVTLTLPCPAPCYVYIHLFLVFVRIESGSASGSESGSEEEEEEDTTVAAAGAITDPQKLQELAGVDAEGLSPDAISKAKQSRSEKKARKAMLKLGLKSHPG